MNELDVIRLFYPGESVTDLSDCALIPGGGSSEGSALVTTDALSEGTHFRLEWSSPEDLAIKLLHVNLSDLAASGAEPSWALLTLGIPGHVDDDFLHRFAVGLLGEMHSNRVRLIGGDSFRSQTLELSMTMSGKALRPLTRAGARAGDALYVTGQLGLSLAGYRVLSQGLELTKSVRDAALERHLRPRARLDWGRFIASDPGVHACMDLSDGLAEDAPKLARASHVTLEIDLGRLPIVPELQAVLTLGEACTSGEELELLFLGDPGLAFPFPCTEIGRALPQGREEAFFLENGRPTDPPRGFRHFQ